MLYSVITGQCPPNFRAQSLGGIQESLDRYIEYIIDTITVYHTVQPRALKVGGPMIIPYKVVNIRLITLYGIITGQLSAYYSCKPLIIICYWGEMT